MHVNCDSAHATCSITGALRDTALVCTYRVCRRMDVRKKAMRNGMLLEFRYRGRLYMCDHEI